MTDEELLNRYFLPKEMTLKALAHARREGVKEGRRKVNGLLMLLGKGNKAWNGTVSYDPRQWSRIEREIEKLKQKEAMK